MNEINLSISDIVMEGETTLGHCILRVNPKLIH